MAVGAEIRQLLVVNDSILAVGREGVYRKMPHAASWQPALKVNPSVLSDRNISALARDGEGHLWIGYFDRGVDILAGDRGRTLHIEDEHVFCVNRIVLDDRSNTVNVATANGLVRMNQSGSVQQVLTRADGLIADHVTDVALFRKGLAVATPAGLTLIDASGARSLYAFQGLANNHVYTLGVQGDELLAGTLGGISQLRSDSVARNFTTATSTIRHNWITAIVPVGNAWYDKLARFYLRTKHDQEFEDLTRRAVASFSGTDLEQYFNDVVSGGSAALYLRLNQYAQARFPHNPVFVRNLLYAYQNPATRDQAAWQSLYKVRLAKANIAAGYDIGPAQQILRTVASDSKSPYQTRIRAATALSGNRENLGSAELNLLAGDASHIPVEAADKFYFYDARMAAANATIDPSARFALLSHCVIDFPRREEARIPLFESAIRIKSDEYALGAIRPVLDANGQVGDRSQSAFNEHQPEGDDNGDETLPPLNGTASSGSPVRARLEDSVGELLVRLGQARDAVAHFQTARRLAVSSTERARLRRRIERIQAWLRVQSQNASRQPILHEALEQDRIVRPKLPVGSLSMSPQAKGGANL